MIVPLRNSPMPCCCCCCCCRGVFPLPCLAAAAARARCDANKTINEIDLPRVCHNRHSGVGTVELGEETVGTIDLVQHGLDGAVLLEDGVLQGTLLLKPGFEGALEGALFGDDRGVQVVVFLVGERERGAQIFDQLVSAVVLLDECFDSAILGDRCDFQVMDRLGEHLEGALPGKDSGAQVVDLLSERLEGATLRIDCNFQIIVLLVESSEGALLGDDSCAHVFESALLGEDCGLQGAVLLVELFDISQGLLEPVVKLIHLVLFYLVAKLDLLLFQFQFGGLEGRTVQRGLKMSAKSN